MSSSDSGSESGIPVNAELTAATSDLAAKLADAVNRGESIGDDALAQLLATAVRLYSAKADSGHHARPFGEGGFGVTVTDVMITTTAMLHAVNVQLFELGMWQAWTGSHALHRGEPAPA